MGVGKPPKLILPEYWGVTRGKKGLKIRNNWNLKKGALFK